MAILQEEINRIDKKTAPILNIKGRSQQKIDG